MSIATSIGPRRLLLAFCALAFCALACLALGQAPAAQPAAAAERAPNFVVIFADDLGYGDLGCFGHPTIATPRLDRMAREGAKLTQFYSAASVCTPSRAALLTGRLPIRSGMCSSKRRVLFPDSTSGLPASELTIAEALKPRGYATACVGKWHLGHLKPFLPTSNGFDTYFGIPYSNDMDRDASKGPRGRAAFLDPQPEYWNVPILRGEETVERPADQWTITRRYTDEAIAFIRAKKDVPFFLYLAHSLPHVPLFADKARLGTSARGLYGDVVEEIDAEVGRLLDAIASEGLDERTLVIFTSDNGPWLVYDQHGGSAGLLRGGKGTTWDGGMREPCIVRWPGKVPAGSVIDGLASTLDVFPTILSLAGVDLPKDRAIDGVDMSGLLTRGETSKRDHMLYYRGAELYATRLGAYKAHFISEGAYGGRGRAEHDPPLLFHLEQDPSEKYDIAAANPDLIAAIRAVVERHRADLVPGEDQLMKR